MKCISLDNFACLCLAHCDDGSGDDERSDPCFLETAILYLQFCNAVREGFDTGFNLHSILHPLVATIPAIRSP